MANIANLGPNSGRMENDFESDFCTRDEPKIVFPSRIQEHFLQVRIGVWLVYWSVFGAKCALWFVWAPWSVDCRFTAPKLFLVKYFRRCFSMPENRLVQSWQPIVRGIRAQPLFLLGPCLVVLSIHYPWWRPSIVMSFSLGYISMHMYPTISAVYLDLVRFSYVFFIF